MRKFIQSQSKLVYKQLKNSMIYKENFSPEGFDLDLLLVERIDPSHQK